MAADARRGTDRMHARRHGGAGCSAATAPGTLAGAGNGQAGAGEAGLAPVFRAAPVGRRQPQLRQLPSAVAGLCRRPAAVARLQRHRVFPQCAGPAFGAAEDPADVGRPARWRRPADGGARHGYRGAFHECRRAPDPGAHPPDSRAAGAVARGFRRAEPALRAADLRRHRRIPQDAGRRRHPGGPRPARRQGGAAGGGARGNDRVHRQGPVHPLPQRRAGHRRQGATGSAYPSIRRSHKSRCA
jgi:hypothetical protein